MRAALLSLLLATSALGQTVERDGGCWMPKADCLSTAQELARLRAENAELRAAPPISPGLVAVLLALAVGAGVAIGRSTR